MILPEFVSNLFNYILHLDNHLNVMIHFFGAWIYVFLFALLFFETVLIIVPFLPGDSLVIALGSVALGSDTLNVNLLFAAAVTASVAGNSINYFTGKWLGPKLFQSDKAWFFKKKHIEATHQYFERYGAKTILIARFIPLVRTIAPIMAGVGLMPYFNFLIYNLLGSALWMSLILYSSYWFGNIPIVREHFYFVIIAIIALSIIPLAIEMIRRKLIQENHSN